MALETIEVWKRLKISEETKDKSKRNRMTENKITDENEK